MKENTREVTSVIITAEAQKTMSEAQDLAETIITIKAIENNEGYINASETLKIIKIRFSELDSLRKSLTAPLDESKKKIMDLFRKPLDLLVQAEAKLKSAMLKFQQEQETKRRETEAKLRVEQAKKEAELQAKIEEAKRTDNQKLNWKRLVLPKS